MELHQARSDQAHFVLYPHRLFTTPFPLFSRPLEGSVRVGRRAEGAYTRIATTRFCPRRPCVSRLHSKQCLGHCEEDLEPCSRSGSGRRAPPGKRLGVISGRPSPALQSSSPLSAAF